MKHTTTKRVARYLQLFLLGGLQLITCTTVVRAQNFNDALRYSFFQPVGTARFTAVGGAMSSLGSDFSVLSTNPAGIAWMRRSELSLTPALSIDAMRAELQTSQQQRSYREGSTKFIFPSGGLVIATPGNYNRRALNFAMGVNRLADFNEQIFYRGNSRGSLLNRFVEQANSDIGLDPFEAGLAYNADALLEDNQGFYYSDFEGAPNAIITREEEVTRTGGITELSFGLAANYRDRVLLGASLGVPIVDFRQEKNYTETDANAEVPFFDNLNYTEVLATTGGGINLKLGMVVRPTQAIRLGLAIHTPTAYQFSDTFYTSMVYNYTLDNSFPNRGEANSPEGTFSYGLRTPWRVIGGLGVLFAKNGFVSADLEYLNYGANRLRYRDFPEDENRVNINIIDNLQEAYHLRVGGEYVFSDLYALRVGDDYGMKRLSLRAGFNAVSSARRLNEDPLMLAFSTGAGVRFRAIYLDFAWRWQLVDESYVPYETVLAPSQLVNINGSASMAMLTFGVRF